VETQAVHDTTAKRKWNQMHNYIDIWTLELCLLNVIVYSLVKVLLFAKTTISEEGTAVRILDIINN
jgi:hypothetical protein